MAPVHRAVAQRIAERAAISPFSPARPASRSERSECVRSTSICYVLRTCVFCGRGRAACRRLNANGRPSGRGSQRDTSGFGQRLLLGMALAYCVCLFTMALALPRHLPTSGSPDRQSRNPNPEIFHTRTNCSGDQTHRLRELLVPTSLHSVVK